MYFEENIERSRPATEMGDDPASHAPMPHQMPEEVEPASDGIGDAPNMDLDLDQIHALYGLSVRAFNVCSNSGLVRLSQIRAFAVEHGGFKKLRNCGTMTQRELDDILAKTARSAIGVIGTEVRRQKPWLIKATKSLTGGMRDIPLKNPTVEQLNILFGLTVRAYNVCKDVGFERFSQMYDYAMEHGGFRNIRNCGASTQKELEELLVKVEDMYQSVLSPMAEDEERGTRDGDMGLVLWAMHHGIDTATLGTLFNAEKRMTLLRFLSSVLNAGPTTTMQRVYWMFLHGNHATATLYEIGEQHGITRERARQLLNKLYRAYPGKLAFVADLPGVREHYPELVTTSPVFVADQEFAHRLNEKEGTEWSPLFMLFLTMTINGPRYVYCTWADLFGRSAGFRGLDRAFPFMVERDLVGPLRRVGVVLASRYEEKRRESEPMEILAGIPEESGEQHARLLDVLRVLLPKPFPDASIREGLVILPANRKSNQEDLLEEILVALDGPSHVTTILEKWHERFPGRPITEAGIRSVAIRNRERFFSVGRTSTYGLRRWEAERPLLKGGTIRDIVADLLEPSSVPLHFEEIVEGVRKYRPATNVNSVRWNLQLDGSGRFVLLPKGFVGLAGRQYDTIPEPPASVPGSLMRKVVVSRFIGQHRRKLSEFIAARCKATPERIERVIDEAIREGRFHVDGMGHIRETPGESAPPDPWPDELPLDW